VQDSGCYQRITGTILLSGVGGLQCVLLLRNLFTAFIKLIAVFLKRFKDFVDDIHFAHFFILMRV
jgi:hypothetical protein